MRTYSRLLLVVMSFLALFGSARAENITVRNKIIHQPRVIYVAEYRENITTGVATRVNGPYMLESDDERTWEKSAANGPYRWIRWSTATNEFPSEYSRAAWNAVNWKFKISNGVLTCNVNDYSSPGNLVGKTDTGLALQGLASFIGQHWRNAWDTVWGPLSTAGTSLDVKNETEVVQYFCEYQEKIGGRARRLQGPFTVQPGETKRITKGTLSPGYAARFIYFQRTNSFPQDVARSDFSATFGTSKEGDGASIGRLYLYVNRHGQPRAFNHTEWTVKTKMKCMAVNGLADTVAAAGQVATIPNWLGEALGIDALLAPLESAVTMALNSVVPPDLQQIVNVMTGDFVPDATAVARISAARAAWQTHRATIEGLFETDCFCSDRAPGTTSKTLGQRLMEIPGIRIEPNWMSGSGSFHQGFSMTRSIQYKALTISFTSTLITNWADSTKAYNIIALGLTTGGFPKVPQTTKSLSVELYPQVALSDSIGYSWSFSMAAEPLRTIAPSVTVSFDAQSSTNPAPNFGYLGAVGFNVSSTNPGPPSNSQFSYSAAFNAAFPAR